MRPKDKRGNAGFQCICKTTHMQKNGIVLVSVLVCSLFIVFSSTCGFLSLMFDVAFGLAWHGLQCRVVKESVHLHLTWPRRVTVEAPVRDM